MAFDEDSTPLALGVTAAVVAGVLALVIGIAASGHRRPAGATPAQAAAESEGLPVERLRFVAGADRLAPEAPAALARLADAVRADGARRVYLVPSAADEPGLRLRRLEAVRHGLQAQGVLAEQLAELPARAGGEAGVVAEVH